MSKSGKKKTLKRKFKCHQTVNDFKDPSATKGKRQKLAREKYTMSTQATSSSHSSVSNKEYSSNATGGNDESGKTQCDLCKLSYSCQTKLTEHLVSLMHHTKLDDADKSPNHECILCNKTFTDMASYRDHIGTTQHLKKLESLRGNDKEKPGKKSNWGHNKRKDKETGVQSQQPVNGRPQYNSHHWHASRYHHRGHGEGSFQLSHSRDQYNFNPSLRQNQHKQYMHNYIGQQHNEWHEHESYRGTQNNWEKFHDNDSRWQNELGNPSEHRKDTRDFESYHIQDRDIPWGSGAMNFRQKQPFGLKKNINSHMNHSGSGVNDYTQDNFDYCWDEQSFRQHEDFLADMNQNYPSPSFNGGQSQRHSGPHRNSHRLDTEPFRKGNWNGPSFNDRKRPRHGDYPVDTTSKSSKAFGQEENGDNKNRMNPLSHVTENEQFDSTTSRTLQQNSSKTVYQDKSPLDNASDTILERAEKLCKELRQKREASNAQRASLLKSQNHHSVNDKMNNLKKTQQSYIKGHIKTVQKDLTTPEDSTKSTVSSTISQSINSSSSQNNTPPLSSSKVKTLDEIRKSIEQSVLEDTRNAANALNNGKSLRQRTSSLCESSLSSNAPDSVDPCEKAQSLVGFEESRVKLPPKQDNATASSHKTVHKSGPKQSITKENLNKMVNCPRSRTERVQLARMFQSRGDSRSSAPISSRANINLEGLYDSNDVTDIQFDVGGDMATIKLEELSDDIRNQILGLIQDDIGNIHEKHQEEAAKKPELDGKKTRKADSTFNELNVGERDLVDKKVKTKTVRSKTPKRNKMGAGDTVDLVSRSEKFVDIVSVTSPEHEGVESAVYCESLSSRINEHSKKDITNPLDLLTQSSTEHESSLLTSENISSRYPAILSAFGAKVDKMSSLSVEDKPSSMDSGRSSLSLPLSSLSLPVTSSSLALYTSPLLSSHQSSTSSEMPSTYSISSMSMPAGLARSLHSLSDEGHREEQQSPSIGIEQLKDSTNSRTNTSSLTTGESSSMTISELLTLSEQEECVKQEMMSMELRLKRLHRLLEQAVHQINTCTEKKNQLQDEEKNLVNRRISLLREATSTSQPDIHSSMPDLSGEISMQTSVIPSSLTTTTSSQIFSSNTTSTETTRFNRISSDIGSNRLPATSYDSINVENPRSSSSLSRSEWLAKFSAYLPIDALSSKVDSTERTTVSVAPSTNSSIQSLTSTSNAKQLPISTSNLSLLQMVPERDSEPSTHRDANSDCRPTPVVNSRHHGNLFVSGDQDTIMGRSTSFSNATTAEPASSSTHEFTSPIMYVGTIKSGAGQSNKTGISPAPVMVLNNTTISSLFKDSGESGTQRINLTPVRITGSDRGQHEPNKDSTVPPVIRRTSIGSPRQDDSDIGSIASVASGSSLGEQISRYCKFTPGASADGYNPHELSVIFSGPSDTSELKGLDDDQGDSDKSNSIKELAKLKEDVGNNRLYGRLDKESVKSAEALHLSERNNEVPTTSALDKKKKKRKTKQQRDSGMRGRPKPYVISSSSADEVESSKVVESNDVSSLEKRLRKSPESTTDDSSGDLASIRKLSSKSDQLQSNALGQEAVYLSPNKTHNRTEITVAECDSSTNLGIIDSESLNERSSRLKEMKNSFMKNFGRNPTYVNAKTSESKDLSTKRDKDSVIVLSDSEDQGNGQHAKNSQIIDLCVDYDENPNTALVSSNINGENSSCFPGVHGSVCYLHYRDETIYVGFLHYGFKLLHLQDHSHDRQMIVPSLSCMEVDRRPTGDSDKVFVGSGDSVFLYELMNDNKRDVDLGTTVKCLHVFQQKLFVGLDTGEICSRDIKSWKEIDRYICSDCPIHCMASGTEGGTRLLCVASQDSTITVVDADRCLPLRILLGHSKTAFSVQVHDQFVFSGSGDSNVIIHNLHTARVEKVHEDHKGMVHCVFYSHGHLFTGGMDRLVRCYNIKTHKLVQVYYGADMGVIKTIYVHQDKILITGNSVGSVDVVTLDHKAKNICKHKGCGLNFGLASHLSWHIEHQHLSRI